MITLNCENYVTDDREKSPVHAMFLSDAESHGRPSNGAAGAGSEALKQRPGRQDLSDAKRLFPRSGDEKRDDCRVAVAADQTGAGNFVKPLRQAAGIGSSSSSMPTRQKGAACGLRATGRMTRSSSAGSRRCRRRALTGTQTLSQTRKTRINTVCKREKVEENEMRKREKWLLKVGRKRENN